MSSCVPMIWQWVESRWSSETYRNFANGFFYIAAGAVTAMKLGNGKWENTTFNSRLQPTKIGLGGGVASQNLLKLEYSYGTTANNGNVIEQKITVPGVTNSFVQGYTYDELNRLATAEETQNSSQTWKQAFSYDRYGNRNFVESTTTTLPKNCGMSPNFTVCTADVPIVNPTVSTSTNKFSTGYTYDSSGNTTADAESRTFVYDAENKQVSVSDGSGTIGQYVYDGDGKRVKRIVPGGETTVFVYDTLGRLIQEHSTVVQTGNDAKTVYTTADNLGSPRINTDATGQVISRHDYHPFGEEVIRSGYGSDTIRKQFTGYERDAETGLDYAKARYHAPNFGRFMNPDPALSSGASPVPQSWNRYSYALNNPLALTDPSGLKPVWISQYNADGVLTGVQYSDDTWDSHKELLAAGWKEVTYDSNGEFRYSALNGAGGTETAILRQDGLWKWAGDYDNQVTANPSPSSGEQTAGPGSELSPFPAVNLANEMARTDGERHVTFNAGVGPFSVLHSQDIVNGRSGQRYIGFGLGVSFPRLSASLFSFSGRTTTGIVANAQVAVGEAIGVSGNVSDPANTTSGDLGIGTPQAGAGVNLVLPYNPRHYIDYQALPQLTQQQLRRYNPGYPRY